MYLQLPVGFSSPLVIQYMPGVQGKQALSLTSIVRGLNVPTGQGYIIGSAVPSGQ